LDGAMRARFHAEPMVQATELLLQERTPRDVASSAPGADEVERRRQACASFRRPTAGASFAARSTPATHLLSNGRYAVMLTAAGSGYSRWRDLAVTRWREDATRDDWGSYIFLRDVAAATCGRRATSPAASSRRLRCRFNEDRAEFTRRDGTITTTLDVLVSPEDDAEVRRVSISNAAAKRARDRAHVLCRARAGAAGRRRRASGLLETVRADRVCRRASARSWRRGGGASRPNRRSGRRISPSSKARRSGEAEIETDRARFLGRGRDGAQPIAVDGARLSNTSAPCSIRSSPCAGACGRAGRDVRIAFWTVGRAVAREVLDLVDKHHDANAFERAATLAWTQAQVQLHHLGVDAGEANLFQRLAGHVLYANPAMRPSSDASARRGGASGGALGQGISGDLPIVLLRIDDVEDIDIVRSCCARTNTGG
jgi:cyclic beta-1,2-glucan synthetase